MASEIIWRVEWVKRTVYKIKSFKDEHAARRLFQKHGTACLSKVEYQQGGPSKILMTEIVGDFKF